MAKVPAIIPITDLRQDAAKALARVRRSREPVVITQRGRAAAVMLSIEAYEHGERERHILRLLATGEREIAKGKGRDLDAVLAASDLLLMASGTATVEATIFGTPMIVTYKTGALNYLVFRAMARVKHVSMANILEGREVIPEFLQSRARPELIAAEAVSMIEGGGLSHMREELARVRAKLGTPGASDRAAAEVLSYLGTDSG